MSYQYTIEDICQQKHKGNKSSQAANPHRQSKAKMKEEILALLRHNNLTGKQIAELLNVPFNAISGRFSELKASGDIEATCDRIEGSCVLRIRRRAA